ncbi:MAG TPA: peroxiredoxin [Burkholderiaceae bacterium]|nr:peroxiredoxin [Burkholderiaceae bacterium]
MSDNASLVGKTVPDFTAPMTGGTPFNLSDFRGRHLVLYFYPKDATPGCTTQGQQFRDLHAQFQAAGAEIVGVSRDSLKSHDNFRAKMEFPFHLIADTDETVCTMFDVIKMKNMYGKQVRGIERSTFVIDRTGVVREELRGVKVPGHADQVLAIVRSLG